MTEFDSKALAAKQSEKKAKTLGYTLGHLHSEELLDTLDDTITELQVGKLAERLCDVRALALVDGLASMLNTE